MSPLRWVGRVVAVALSVCALAGVVRLVAPPSGVPQQLAFLRASLDDGAGESAQGMFPEGYFFLHVLYGLSWVSVGMQEPEGSRGDALREARWALQRLDGPDGRAPFSQSLTPSYGVFYRGWTNWLRGGILRLRPAEARDPAEVRRFEEDSAALAAAFDASASPYLEAYPGQAWPVDSTVAVASLRLHDALLPPRFAGTVARWLDGVRGRLDPHTGLIPHRVDPGTGDPIEIARGTSQSMILRFLPEIDPAFAAAQYTRFRDDYLVRPLGLGPAVREYPTGVDGPADVDSGPLPLGVSLSATVVTLGAARVNGDTSLARALDNYGEVAGLPVTTPWTKRYAFGLLPIGDAFLVWSRTAHPWVADPSPPPPTISWWWRLPLLSLFVAAGTGPWLPALRRRVVRSRRAGA
ncbi:hypothetical protein GCM10010399_72170 [Dactylosporangium fulvum]|uniref:Uncharacterized protein n=1 Tax=Dactylosporangium fulvum TaxID=53359 RepID=A0ABY5VWS7_9ACTN|nr:hypothetical protein [Dactylosporangium fulvum]UWP82075.1 hypothetical protein Dfulv_44595 [Dactylosporangium fulvum]